MEQENNKESALKTVFKMATAFVYGLAASNHVDGFNTAEYVWARLKTPRQ